jgi:hypothetical protein
MYSVDLAFGLRRPKTANLIVDNLPISGKEWSLDYVRPAFGQYVSVDPRIFLASFSEFFDCKIYLNQRLTSEFA